MTCPIDVGFRPTVLASSFCSLHPANKILKETSLDLSFFLDFSLDGRPIKFQMHSCRGNIVGIIRAPQGPPEKKKWGGQGPPEKKVKGPAPPVPPPMRDTAAEEFLMNRSLIRWLIYKWHHTDGNFVSFNFHLE